MKINPEAANIIKVIKDETPQAGRTRNSREAQQNAEDIVTIENRQASASRVETVEQAKQLLDQVNRSLENNSAGVYNLNSQRIMDLIS